VIITGIQGSGKTTACKYLCQKYNIEHISFWNDIRPVIKNIDDYRSYIMKCTDNKIYDMGLNESVAMRLLNLDCNILLIQTDRSKRYERLMKRNNQSIHEVENYYSTVFNGLEETEKYLNPNYIICNNSNIETYYSELDKICL